MLCHAMLTQNSNPTTTDCPKEAIALVHTKGRWFYAGADSSCLDFHFRAWLTTTQQPREFRDIEPPYLCNERQQDYGQHHLRAE